MNPKLYVRDVHGEFVPADGSVILEGARVHLRNRMRRGASLGSPSAVREYLMVTLGDRDCEYFCVILLDLCVALRNVECGADARNKARSRTFLLHINSRVEAAPSARWEVSAAVAGSIAPEQTFRDVDQDGASDDDCEGKEQPAVCAEGEDTKAEK